MELNIKLIHKNTTLGLDSVNVCMYVYIYIYILYSQIMVYAARHTVRVFISYTLTIVRCQQMVFVTVPCLLMTTDVVCIFSAN